MNNIKFLTDECLGLQIAKWLRLKGFDVLSILEGYSGLDDQRVLHKAFQENRILLTIDKDFGDLVFVKKMQHCGVVLLRLKSRSPQYQVSILEKFFTKYLKDFSCNFIVITDANVRVIKQPLH